MLESPDRTGRTPLEVSGAKDRHNSVSVHGSCTSPGVPPILKRQSAFEAFLTTTA